MRAAEILVGLLEDPELDLTARSPPPPDLITTSPVRSTPGPSTRASSTIPPSRSNAYLRLSVVRTLWRTTRTAIPHRALGAAGERLLACLVQHEDTLVCATDEARAEWALLCVQVLLVCESNALRAFWASAGTGWEPEVRCLVWKTFVEQWTEDGEGGWEGAAVLLGVPFA